MKPLTITPPKGEKVKQITRNDDGTVTIEFEADSYKFEDLPKTLLDEAVIKSAYAQLKLMKLSKHFGGGKWTPVKLKGGIYTIMYDSLSLYLPTFPTKEIAEKVYEQNKELFEQYWRS